MFTIVISEHLLFGKRIATFNTEFWLKKRKKNIYQRACEDAEVSVIAFHFPEAAHTAVLSDSLNA